jgi:ribosomal protein L13
MESIISIITAVVVLYVLIKVANSTLVGTLVDTGDKVITVNAKELVFDAEQRLGTKLHKAKESGKAITSAERIKLEVEFGLTKATEEL